MKVSAPRVGGKR
ncbi:hypothetical protein QTP70_022762 [Hemibagrus guttatus]|nr:hypothetical protein QTP70_022762 [Hemibagrus guttatus]KAK3530411.1 hypothetical protein QTP86_024445 [Hemibagrus guttatus]